MTKFSNDKIGRIAVHAITTECLRPDSFLKADIPVGDTAPSFDGSITLFKDGSEKKESYMDEIPVQVKGTMKNEFSKSTRSFNLEIDHYKNFYKRGGCLLLVVEILENQATKIFYKQLLSIELREIIETYGKQLTHAVQLRTLEETTLYRVCNIFSDQMKRQPQILLEANQYTDSDFNAIKFISPTYNFFEFGLLEIFKHNFFQYGVKDNIEIPLRTVQFESMSFPRTDRVKISDGEIDAAIEIVINKSKIIKLCIENTLEIKINTFKNTFSINILEVKSIDSQIKVLNILKNIFITGKLELNGVSFELSNQSFEEELARLNEELIFWSEATDVFNFLKIDIATNFIYEESVYEDLKQLHQILLLKNYDGITPENPETPSFFKYDVGGLYIVLFYNPNSEIKFVNPFTKDFIETSSMALESKSSNEVVNISPFLLLEDETLENATNLDFKLINDSYELIDLSQIHLIFDIINEFCLRCINAYDKNRNAELLKTVLFLYNFLEEHHEHPSYKNLIFVNKMQTVLRLKEAYSYDSSDEKNQIVKFKIQAIKNNEDNVDLLFCLDTLLSNSPEAKHHFESFDDDKKQSFTSLPIFHMYNKLIDS